MTKKIILGAAAALVLAPTAALAADLAVKAPPPVAIYDWTGFYIGGSAGGSVGTTDHINPLSGGSFASGYDITGWLAGGTVGYNWQLASFVVGFEGDASWVNETGRNADIGIAGDPAFTSTTKETWNATARLRAGYAVNNLLFYATGGFAAAGAEAGIKDSNSNVLLASVTSTHTGWTAGGGLEWGFAPNWSAKFEVLYMKFNSTAFNTVQGEGGLPRTVPLTDTVARAGVNFRFGGPAVARY